MVIRFEVREERSVEKVASILEGIPVKGPWRIKTLMKVLTNQTLHKILIMFNKRSMRFNHKA